MYVLSHSHEHILTFVTHVGGVNEDIKAHCAYTRRSYVVRSNLFNLIKEPCRQSFERLLGRLKVTRVFVSSHLTHTRCVTGYETIRRTPRQWQTAPI